MEKQEEPDFYKGNQSKPCVLKCAEELHKVLDDLVYYSQSCRKMFELIIYPGETPQEETTIEVRSCESRQYSGWYQNTLYTFHLVYAGLRQDSDLISSNYFKKMNENMRGTNKNIGEQEGKQPLPAIDYPQNDHQCKDEIKQPLLAMESRGCLQGDLQCDNDRKKSLVALDSEGCVQGDSLDSLPQCKEEYEIQPSVNSTEVTYQYILDDEPETMSSFEQAYNDGENISDKMASYSDGSGICDKMSIEPQSQMNGFVQLPDSVIEDNVNPNRHSGIFSLAHDDCEETHDTGNNKFTVRSIYSPFSSDPGDMDSQKLLSKPDESGSDGIQVDLMKQDTNDNFSNLPMYTGTGEESESMYQIQIMGSWSIDEKQFSKPDMCESDLSPSENFAQESIKSEDSANVTSHEHKTKVLVNCKRVKNKIDKKSLKSAVEVEKKIATQQRKQKSKLRDDPFVIENVFGDVIYVMTEDGNCNPPTETGGEEMTIIDQKPILINASLHSIPMADSYPTGIVQNNYTSEILSSTNFNDPSRVQGRKYRPHNVSKINKVKRNKKTKSAVYKTKCVKVTDRKLMKKNQSLGKNPKLNLQRKKRQQGKKKPLLATKSVVEEPQENIRTSDGLDTENVRGQNHDAADSEQKQAMIGRPKTGRPKGKRKLPEQARPVKGKIGRPRKNNNIENELVFDLNSQSEFKTEKKRGRPKLNALMTVDKRESMGTPSSSLIERGKFIDFWLSKRKNRQCGKFSRKMWKKVADRDLFSEKEIECTDSNSNTLTKKRKGRPKKSLDGSSQPKKSLDGSSQPKKSIGGIGKPNKSLDRRKRRKKINDIVSGKSDVKEKNSEKAIDKNRIVNDESSKSLLTGTAKDKASDEMSCKGDGLCTSSSQSEINTSSGNLTENKCDKTGTMMDTLITTAPVGDKEKRMRVQSGEISDKTVIKEDFAQESSYMEETSTNISIRPINDQKRYRECLSGDLNVKPIASNTIDNHSNAYSVPTVQEPRSTGAGLEPSLFKVNKAISLKHGALEHKVKKKIGRPRKVIKDMADEKVTGDGDCEFKKNVSDTRTNTNTIGKVKKGRPRKEFIKRLNTKNQQPDVQNGVKIFKKKGRPRKMSLSEVCHKQESPPMPNSFDSNKVSELSKINMEDSNDKSDISLPDCRDHCFNGDFRVSNVTETERSVSKHKNKKHPKKASSLSVVKPGDISLPLKELIKKYGHVKDENRGRKKNKLRLPVVDNGILDRETETLSKPSNENTHVNVGESLVSKRNHIKKHKVKTSEKGVLNQSNEKYVVDDMEMRPLEIAELPGKIIKKRGRPPKMPVLTCEKVESVENMFDIIKKGRTKNCFDDDDSDVTLSYDGFKVERANKILKKYRPSLKNNCGVKFNGLKKKPGRPRKENSLLHRMKIENPESDFSSQISLVTGHASDEPFKEINDFRSIDFKWRRKSSDCIKKQRGRPKKIKNEQSSLGSNEEKNVNKVGNVNSSSEQGQTLTTTQSGPSTIPRESGGLEVKKAEKCHKNVKVPRVKKKIGRPKKIFTGDFVNNCTSKKSSHKFANSENPDSAINLTLTDTTEVKEGMSSFPTKVEQGTSSSTEAELGTSSSSTEAELGTSSPPTEAKLKEEKIKSPKKSSSETNEVEKDTSSTPVKKKRGRPKLTPSSDQPVKKSLKGRPKTKKCPVQFDSTDEIFKDLFTDNPDEEFLGSECNTDKIYGKHYSQHKAAKLNYKSQKGVNKQRVVNTQKKRGRPRKTSLSQTTNDNQGPQKSRSLAPVIQEVQSLSVGNRSGNELEMPVIDFEGCVPSEQVNTVKSSEVYVDEETLSTLRKMANAKIETDKEHNIPTKCDMDENNRNSESPIKHVQKHEESLEIARADRSPSKDLLNEELSRLQCSFEVVFDYEDSNNQQ